MRPFLAPCPPLKAAPDWEAAHGADRLAELVAWLGPALFAALWLWAVVGAWRQRRRYRAVDVLGAHQLEAVHQALAAAERRTVGEIVPIVLERSDRHPQAEPLAALLGLFAGSLLFAPVLSWQRPLLVGLAQAAAMLLAWLPARGLPGYRRRFIGSRRATEVAQEQAVQEFHALGLRETVGRTGILLLVSLWEHRVVVLADEGIAAQVDPERWEDVDQVVLERVRAGDLCQGLVEGIRVCGEILAEHFPWREGDRDELPDRVIVRAE